MNDEQEKHMRQLAMQRRADASIKQKDRCPCGGIILADTEKWPSPLCYECSKIPLKEIDELKRKYAWLIRHAWICAAISKAKAAELLGCSLIDFDEKISQANEELENG